MSRLKPLSAEELAKVSSRDMQGKFGFLPNAARILARRPETLRASQTLYDAIFGEKSTISKELANLVAQMASMGAQCMYCTAHTAHQSTHSRGISPEKQAAFWEYETSPLFEPGERAAMRVAFLAGQVPNGVTDEDFAALRTYFSEEQIVDIVSVIAFYGFYNRFNDTMATQLENEAIEAGERYHAKAGWSIGRHGSKTPTG